MLADSAVEMVRQKLVPIEWFMVAVFSVGIIAWGFVMRRATGSLEGSFLAGRKVPGLLASLSTVATNLNANDFIGGAGFVYAFGVVVLHGSWVNSLALILVSLFLVQKLRRLNVFTLGGWLERRYCFTVGFMYSLAWSAVWMLFNVGLYPKRPSAATKTRTAADACNRPGPSELRGSPRNLRAKCTEVPE